MPVYVMAAAMVIGAAATIYSSQQQAGAAEKGQTLVREQWEYQKTQDEAERQRLEREKAEEEARLAPWREAQSKAIEKLQGIIENPELSDWAKLRMDEEEKAINKELASKGLLFSGAAAEMRQKARQSIMAQESQWAQQTIANISNAAPPASGVSNYDVYLANLEASRAGLGMAAAATQGQYGIEAAQARSAGLYGAANIGLAGAQGYLMYQGLQQQPTTGTKTGLGYNEGISMRETPYI